MRLWERPVYSHSGYRVSQAPAERHGFTLTVPPLEGGGTQKAMYAASKGAWPSLPGGRYYIPEPIPEQQVHNLDQLIAGE